MYKLLEGELRHSKEVVAITSFEHVVDLCRSMPLALASGLFTKICSRIPNSFQFTCRYYVVRGTDDHTAKFAQWPGGGWTQGWVSSSFAGSGVWELRVEAPLYRVVAEGTEEEGLLRIGTIKKIQDFDSSTMDTVAFS